MFTDRRRRQRSAVDFRPTLFGVSPHDLPTLAGVTIVLTGVALAASYIPALRAMRLDPITTLHAE